MSKINESKKSNLDLSSNISSGGVDERESNSQEIKELASDARGKLVFDENGLLEVAPQSISHDREVFVSSDGLEVQGLNFENKDLSEVNFEGQTKFVNCNFRNANLFGCDLSKVEFIDCDFSGACMDYVTMGVLIRCVLRSVSLLDFDFTKNTALILCNFREAIIGISTSDEEIVIIDCIFKNIRPAVDGGTPVIQAFENLGRKFSLKHDGTFDVDFTGCRLKHGADLTRLDLTGVKFMDMDLSGYSFRDVSLSNMSFIRTNLERVNFGFNNLVNVRFLSTNLDYVNFGSKLLQDVVFHCVDLTKAHFYDCQLKGVTFAATDLSEVIFCAKFKDVIICDTNLDKTNFVESVFDGVSFRSVKNLESAKFSPNYQILIVRNTYLKRLLIGDGIDYTSQNLSFVGSKFDGGSLVRAKLSGLSFRDAYLRKVDFSFADLRGVDFTGADLHWAKFDGALVDETTKIDFPKRSTYYIADCEDGIKRIFERDDLESKSPTGTVELDPQLATSLVFEHKKNQRLLKWVKRLKKKR